MTANYQPGCWICLVPSPPSVPTLRYVSYSCLYGNNGMHRFAPANSDMQPKGVVWICYQQHCKRLRHSTVECMQHSIAALKVHLHLSSRSTSPLHINSIGFHCVHGSRVVCVLVGVEYRLIPYVAVHCVLDMASRVTATLMCKGLAASDTRNHCFLSRCTLSPVVSHVSLMPVRTCGQSADA